MTRRTWPINYTTHRLPSGLLYAQARETLF